MMVILRHATRFIAYPAAYLASVVPVSVATLVSTVILEDTISSYLYPFEGDFTLYGYLALISSLLLVAVPVYGVLSLLLYRLEGTSRPSFSDHLRHCVFGYGAFGATGVVTLLTYQRELAAGYTDPKPETELLVWTAGCAILANALALLWRRRSRGDRSGGTL